jgi:glycosyltransferase involved in cell wall biosynthesis
MATLGVIAIGRNEGQRLRRCLESVTGRGLVAVYVDSGSSDGSIELARSLGVEVIELDLSRPFTAALARNEGFERLCQIDPEVRFVQFVDGDCEVAEGWLDKARRVLDE